MSKARHHGSTLMTMTYPHQHRQQLRHRGKQKTMMKGIWIAILLMLVGTGCATPYARQWHFQLWQVQDEPNETPELGRLEMETSTFGILCTEFRQVGRPSNAFIGVSVSRRNQTNDTITLEFNPVQVVDASQQVLMKSLSLDHVMYKLYGGALREQAQIARLAETSQPLVSHGSSDLMDALIPVINTYRAYERHAIIRELHRKEALPYDLYYQSFTPTSLPPGVATVWTQYYPYTTNTITVMLQGQQVSDGMTFGPPPPPPPPSPEQIRRVSLGTYITGAIVGTFLVVVFLVSLPSG